MNPRVTRNAQGFVTREEWRLQGQRHRVDGPAMQIWEMVDGRRVLTCEEWRLQGRYHRVDGPASRSWEIEGDTRVLTCEDWWLQGRYHRVDGPACREWEVVDGRVVLTLEEWRLENRLHRVDGPAYREWVVTDGDGNPLPEPFQYNERWYLHGRSVDPIELHQAASTIRRWFLRHRARRERIISALLEKDGMVVFPGLMGLLRRY